MEGYVYLGEHYDVLGRDIGISDKKIGLSTTPLSREQQLNRTKSPIGYHIVTLFKVDNMSKVEKMLHSILDSRRVYGEWFRDDDDTLISEFVNFMLAYGAEMCDINVEKERMLEQEDMRLVEVAKNFGENTTLIRTYKGVDYEVILDTKGMLNFNGEKFNTPNKFYNNGLVKMVKGKRGNSGTNQLSQFKVKSTGQRLRG